MFQFPPNESHCVIWPFAYSSSWSSLALTLNESLRCQNAETKPKPYLYITIKSEL